jgi:hypothetical protein
MTERTEIEWMYKPADLFEAPYRQAGSGFVLSLDAGRAVATLSAAQDPVPSDVEERVRRLLESVCLVRQLQLHRQFSLEGPRIFQHEAGRKNISIRLGGAAVVMTAGHVDVLVTDSSGKVVRDSKAERVSREVQELDSLTAKLAQSATLRSLFESYSRAVADPDDELVHLYEIRDGLLRHYGNEQSARNALGINKTEWQRLGVLANVEPLDEGRHRGKHSAGRRPASVAELREARELARRCIEAFAQAI